jgi:hypothetical protein
MTILNDIKSLFKGDKSYNKDYEEFNTVDTVEVIGDKKKPKKHDNAQKKMHFPPSASGYILISGVFMGALISGGLLTTGSPGICYSGFFPVAPQKNSNGSIII